MSADPQTFPEPEPEPQPEPSTGLGPLDSDNNREYHRDHRAWLARKQAWEAPQQA